MGSEFTLIQNIVTVICYIGFAGIIGGLWYYILQALFTKKFGAGRIIALLFLFVTNVLGLAAIIGLTIIHFNL